MIDEPSNLIAPLAQGARALLCCAALALQVSPALAEAKPKTPPAMARAEPKASDAAQFCVNIADKAADARFAWEAKTLADLQAKVETRTAELDAKRAEVEDWVARRQALLDQAQASVVAIYAKMRADAAARQLAAMDEPMAAAVLTKLEPRAASKILDEMDPAKAVALTALLAGSDAAKPKNGKS